MGDNKQQYSSPDSSGPDDPVTQIPPADRPTTASEDEAEKAEPPKAFGSDAPDGGATAWLVVAGAWCTSVCSFGWLNSKDTLHAQVNTR